MASGAATPNLAEQARRQRCRDQREFGDQNTDKVCVSCECGGQSKDKCMLHPHHPLCCPVGQDGHHPVPVFCFMPPGQRTKERSGGKKVRYEGCWDYEPEDAPTLCLAQEEHRIVGNKFNQLAAKQPNKKWDYPGARQAAIESMMEARKDDCTPECLGAQLDAYHDRKLSKDAKLRADYTGKAGVQIPTTDAPPMDELIP